MPAEAYSQVFLNPQATPSLPPLYIQGRSLGDDVDHLLSDAPYGIHPLHFGRPVLPLTTTASVISTPSVVDVHRETLATSIRSIPSTTTDTYPMKSKWPVPGRSNIYTNLENTRPHHSVTVNSIGVTAMIILVGVLVLIAIVTGGPRKWRRRQSTRPVEEMQMMGTQMPYMGADPVVSPSWNAGTNTAAYHKGQWFGSLDRTWKRALEKVPNLRSTKFSIRRPASGGSLPVHRGTLTESTTELGSECKYNVHALPVYPSNAYSERRFWTGV